MRAHAGRHRAVDVVREAVADHHRFAGRDAACASAVSKMLRCGFM